MRELWSHLIPIKSCKAYISIAIEIAEISIAISIAAIAE